LRTLNLAEAAGPSPELAAAYSIAYAVAGILPARSLADLYFARATGVLEKLPDPTSQSYLQLLEGVYCCGVADWERAEKALSRGLKTASALGFHRRRDEINLGLAYWHLFRGNLDSALAAAEAIHPRGDTQGRFWRALMRATVLSYGGREEEASPFVLELESEAKTTDRAERIWFFGLASYLALTQDDRPRATALLTTALEAIGAGPPVNLYCVDAYSLSASVAISLSEGADSMGAEENLRGMAREACRSLDAFARVFPVARPRALRQRARLATLAKRTARARRLWARSIAEAQALALPLDEALAERALGQHLDAHDPLRASHLAQHRTLADVRSVWISRM
jgi:hypothetical protein